jgi:hypothetical protein
MPDDGIGKAETCSVADFTQQSASKVYANDLWKYNLPKTHKGMIPFKKATC